MNFKYLFLLLSIGSFIACNGVNKDDQQAKENKLWDEVMEVHDEVMPQMSEITKITRTLKLKVNEESILDPDMKARVLNQLTQLESAEKGMWDWMYNIKQLGPLRDSLPHEGVVSYLNAEKDKISKIKEDMISSIKGGEEIINELKVEEEQAETETETGETE